MRQPTYEDVHELDDEEQALLWNINYLLWILTDGHHHCCECELCEARSCTDVQDEELAFNVPYMPCDPEDDGLDEPTNEEANEA